MHACSSFNRLYLPVNVLVIKYFRATSLLSDVNIVCAVAQMGAPTILVEQLYSVTELPVAISGLQDLYGIGQLSEEGRLQQTGSL